MAYTQTSAKRVWYEDQNLTGTAPSASTDGVPLVDLDALTVVLEANASQTLSGGGSLLCYLYDDAVGAWYRNAENDITSITSAVRRAATNFVSAGCRPASRVAWVTSSVTVSSGTTVRLWIVGGRERGV